MSILSSQKKIKAVIAYDGNAYKGFQKQKSTTNTISQTIEKALHSLGIHSNITGSGRTDAGVHASGQVIHFTLPNYWQDLTKLTLNLNCKLEHIQFKHITYVDTNFHARFSAKKRLYRYIFKTSKPSVFEKKYISYYEPVDTKLLSEALKIFEGKHDFDFFRKTGTQTHTSIREVYQAKYLQHGEYHFIYFKANGFLRAQVRMMIDASILYARNHITLKQLKEQLSCTHRHTTNLAPPQGLYLAKVLY